MGLPGIRELFSSRLNKRQKSSSSSTQKVAHSSSAFAVEPERLNILVIEDENLVRRSLRATLDKSGYGVLEAESGERGLELFQQAHPVAVVLDIMLPGMDGFEVCHRMRAADAHVAILMLTAKGADIDKIYGLEIGADDYLVKPYNPDELVARLKAVLRRSASSAAHGDTLACGPFQIDLIAQKCFKGEHEIDLTQKEISLLATFFKNPDRILNRDQLCEATWGKGHYGCDKTLDVYISRLRQKLEDTPSSPVFLTTVRGAGYRWNSQVDV